MKPDEERTAGRRDIVLGRVEAGASRGVTGIGRQDTVELHAIAAGLAHHGA
jgi:hypothetical protein